MHILEQYSVEHTSSLGKICVEPDSRAEATLPMKATLYNSLKPDYCPLRCCTEAQNTWILAHAKAAPLHNCIQVAENCNIEQNLVKHLLRSEVCSRIERLVI